jgi:NAD(P)H-dependent flavin oxidoreductase YrpB (nitropropane dioxygenase family)
MDFRQLVEAIAETKDRTQRPFGVNLRSDAADVWERAELMVKERVRVASFAMAPSEKLLKRLKDGGLVCIPSIGATRHAEKVAAWGADAVIVQGAEAGGHVGEVATSVLLPQVVDAVDIPVVAAAFFDGRGSSRNLPPRIDGHALPAAAIRRCPTRSNLYLDAR